jgi:transposase-like protein
VKANIDETLAFCRFPSAHTKRLRFTNMLW